MDTQAGSPDAGLVRVASTEEQARQVAKVLARLEPVAMAVLAAAHAPSSHEPSDEASSAAAFADTLQELARG